MRPGDLVRFRATHWLAPGGLDLEDRPWLIGLLVEYHKWEKIATIMHNNELVRVAARDTQKFGRRYLEAYETR
jgi:hypothetical protein